MKVLKAFEAPASFTFRDPDTGQKFSATSRPQIIADIIRYRAQNQLDPILHLPQVLEQYWCTLPENVGKCEPCAKLERTFFQYIKGGVALLQAYIFDKYTTQEEADRRGGICVSCPLNVFPDKKGFLKWSDDQAERSIQQRRSIHHDNLGNCNACGCLLKSKVWYGGSITLKPEEEAEIKKTTPECWQLTNITSKGKS